ncbi:MAG: hypothetical protein AAF387_17200 [Pseudomonadota bacterium]
MDYAEYADIVESRYFGNVAKAESDAVLSCFTSDAKVLIYHGDKEPRHFSRDGRSGGVLLNFFQHLTENFNASFDNFVHYIDPSANRCASRFLVTLNPRQDSPYFAEGVQQLNNCKFFDFRGDLIEYMIIYYASSRAKSDDTPTAYPRA